MIYIVQWFISMHIKAPPCIEDPVKHGGQLVRGALTNFFLKKVSFPDERLLILYKRNKFSALGAAISLL